MPQYVSLLQTDLSPLNIERVSSSLSLALSSPSDPLTLDEVEVVLDITEQLLNFNGASIMVCAYITSIPHVICSLTAFHAYLTPQALFSAS